MKKKICLISFVLIVVAGLLVLGVFYGLKSDNSSAPSDEAATKPTEVVTVPESPPLAKPTDTATEPTEAEISSENVTDQVATEPVTSADNAETAPTEAPTAAEITAPEAMQNLLSQNGNTVDELTQSGCKQLITVASAGANAQIEFYSLVNSEWVSESELSCSGYVGGNGVTENMCEGGYASPKGLYSIGEAFYIYDAPATKLPMFEITPDTYWVDDPDSMYYNQRIEGTANKDWDSAEHMIDYTTAYKYGFVVNYNTEAVYNAGSAIFFHISYGPTAGCIGTSEDYVLKYLSKLDESLNPYILIL